MAPRKPIKLRNEVKIYGWQSCLHFIRNRQHDTIRAYLTEERLPQLSEYLKWCAKNKKAYHIVKNEELDQITSSKHHEGLCVLAYEQQPVKEDSFLGQIARQEIDANQLLILLDGTANPHNIGAIARSMAHFGLTYLLIEKNNMPKIAGSLARVSKGGTEYVRFVQINNPLTFLGKIEKLGYQAIAITNHGKKNLFKHQWKKRSIIFFGNEVKGISKEVEKRAKACLQIPGSNQIESMNVSVACGVVFAEWYCQNQKTAIAD